MPNCILCPRNCVIERTEEKFGFCGSPATPVVNLAKLHFGEEPLISGRHGSGTVFFEGCNLKCVFCQNRAISRGLTGAGKSMSPQALADLYLSLENTGAHNINLVTPMHYAPAVAASIGIAKQKDIKIPFVANVSGYDKVDTLKLFDGLVDIYVTDFKFFSPKLSKQLCGAPDYFSVACLATDEMVRQTGKLQIDRTDITMPLLKKGVIIRHLMLPGQLFDTKHILEYLVPRYGDNVFISLMNQYTPPEGLPGNAPGFLEKKLNPDHYEKMCDYLMQLGQINAFIQEDDASGNALLPDFKTP